MAPDKNGRVVFIGNIPYGVSEEEIIEMFGRVGTVNNFRLVHDKETGRPKGFGFLEYADPDAAASAVRNLNEYDISGRKLRVDWSNDNSGGGGNRGDGPGNATGAEMPQMNQLGADSQAQRQSLLPPLPPGIDLPAGLTCPDAISKTLSSIPAPQLLDIISQMKGLVMTDPAQATELLRAAPQLAYAIFQALLLLGLVDTSMLGSIVQAANPQSAPYAAPPPQAAPVMPPAPPSQYNPTPQPGYPGYPPAQFQPVPTPPVQQPAFQPPPQQQAPPAQPSQQELLAQVMAMTKEQVYQLEPGARQQIITLRAQLGNPIV